MISSVTRSNIGLKINPSYVGKIRYDILKLKRKKISHIALKRKTIRV